MTDTTHGIENLTIAECEAMVSRPGKFEGEARYVPYFWEAFLMGGADRDDGNVLGFDVTAEDRAKFPELVKRRTVKLTESNDGFVCELR